VTTEPGLKPTGATLDAMQREHHPGCIACGNGAGAALGLDFRLADDGSVESAFDCVARLQGYPDRLHGGVVCALLDGAMTNCLFAHGLAAVTAELKVRFREPAVLGVTAVVRARITQQLPPLFRLSAEVVQQGRVVAAGEGAFVDAAAVASLPFRW
jgi:uncharacterized protein (TIGR00369 family)